MRFPKLKLKSSILCLAGSLLLVNYGCTTPEKPADNAEVDSTDEEDAAAVAEEESADGTANDEDTLSDSETDEPASEVASDSTAAVTPEAVVPAPLPTPALVAEVPDSSSERVVRYVLADNTPAYGQADEKGQQVGTYNAGDSLVVKLMGDWAEITDNYFIRSSALSPNLVPRIRMDPWTAAK